ncbi:ASCH domain-containing protein [Paenibacillus sp. P2(2022)]|uniref:ASCH domain-containing protein n=1 Tax=Paenibacillus TaxID=44249 RepID=UPI001C9D6B20|nr:MULTISPECIES: ASCH domain-containing protein [Paenibacillus]MBY7736698.1 ASCH domain-containing protein [Paenibacillus polymyxa]MDG0053481.1 ASCH domain-containing protein [Paenibacillus sp. P2(2022)]
MKVLLSIKPEFVEDIISGKKKFEYRKSIFKRDDISTVVVYATKPFGKVVGEFEIEGILEDSPYKIWQRTKNYSGIKKSFFNSYFRNKEKGYAIQIKEFRTYETPLELRDLDAGIKVAPQSFCYIRNPQL